MNSAKIKNKNYTMKVTNNHAHLFWLRFMYFFNICSIFWAFFYA